MRIAVPLLSLIVLAGCAATINGPSKLTGQDLESAVGLYGPWMDQISIDGHTQYIWRRKLLAQGAPRVCELRVELGFRRMIRRAYLQGLPDACRLFAVRNDPVTK